MPLIWNVPKANDNFVGREDELIQLDTLINKNNKVAIIGVSGIGKTQLTKKYSHLSANKYKMIWWFDMERNIDDQISNLAYQLIENNIASFKIDIEQVSSDALLLYIKEILRKTDKSWMIIFDNVKNVDLISNYIPETHDDNSKKVLITSKNANEEIPKLSLKNFSRKEAHKFIRLALDIDDEVNVDIIINLLDLYPLALAQAASYIKINNIDIKEYSELYKRDPFILWKNEKKLIDTENNYFDLDRKTVKTSIDLNLASIKNESSTSLAIIEIISIINTSLVPEYLIKDIIKSEGLGDEDYKNAIRILKKYSLIEEINKNNQRYFSSLDLVKAITKQQLIEDKNISFLSFISGSKNKSNLEKFYQRIITSILRHINKPWGEMISFINKNTELMNVANMVASNAYEDNIKDPLLLELITALLENNNMIFHTKSNYTNYQELAKYGFDLIETHKVAVPLNLEVRYFFNSIYADFIFESNVITNLYEKKLLELIGYLDNKQELSDLFFCSLTNIGKFYLFRGDINKGLFYINKAHNLANKITNKNYLSDFWYTQTWLYLEKGDYNNASKSIEIFFKIVEDNKIYPMYLYAMNMRSSINFHLNNFKDSLYWANKSYQESLYFFQSDISDISAESLITLARYYKKDKNYHKAIESLEKSINIMDIVFGGNAIDLSQAVAHTLLGEIYVEQKQYQKAYEKYNFAEKYYIKIKIKFNEAQEISNLYADFVLLAIKINDKILAKIYLDKLIKNYSIKHDNVKKVLNAFEIYNFNLLD